jgi:NAD(P)-dependent dehydrogenase (short-subunit alcohol dehydrogenase family)
MREGPVPIEGAVVFLAGASGGIGTVLVRALLDAGAREIVAAALDPGPAGPGVVPFALDITDAPAVRDAAGQWAPRTDILVNAAGVNANQRLFSPGFDERARREMEVNYFGLLNVAAAFAPAMRDRGRGTIVHLLTFLSHVNLPLMASYCASKAAAHSVTQALRAELASAGVRVCGVYPTVVDTPMSRDVDGPKMSADELAATVVQAIKLGTEDVFPGAAELAYRGYLEQPKRVERRMAQRLSHIASD